MKLLKTLMITIVLILMIIPIIPFSERTHIVEKKTNQEKVGDKNSNQDDSAFSDLPRETYSLSNISTAEVTVTKTDGAIDGNNLFVLREINKVSGRITMSAIITDMDGSVLYKRELGENYSLVNSPVEFINSTTILTGDPNGAFLWDVVSNKTKYFNFTGHHEYEYNAISNSIFTFNYSIVNTTGTAYLYDKILEYNEMGNVIWSLDTASFIPPSHACHIVSYYLGAIDLTHSNTIFYDEYDDMIYYNSRNTNTFYKINHSSGEVMWGLGEFGNFTLFDDTGTKVQSLFWHAHAVERVDSNTFIIFDNDYHNPLTPFVKRSSILEITINETTMTANASWIWKPSSQYWTSRWGDADRLPNMNRLGTFGTEYHIGNDLGARLVEVDESGEIVWEMDFLNNVEFDYGIYRTERFRFAPILSSPEDFFSESGKNVSIDWQAWYNFRPKRSITGEYELYLDGVSMDTGIINYDRYWRPFNASFNLGVQANGQYNVTLVITDGEGHTTSDSVNVSVIDWYVNRSGPLIFEMGMEDNEISWSGFTSETLLCNITLNNTHHSTSEWNGSVIPLNLEVIPVGRHLVEFSVYNNSMILYEDIFWIDTYPREEPIFLSNPDDQSIEWNETKVLTWEVYDATPNEWHIYINNSHVMSDTWELSQNLLEWNSPILIEAVYNITIVAEDQTGYNSSNEIILTVIPPIPPVFVSGPVNKVIIWGEPDESFIWDFHGGTQYELWRNNSLLQQGVVESNNYTFTISNWHVEGWRLGLHNLTFILTDNVSSTTHQSWIEVIINPGDAYANSVVTDYSMYFISGYRALGPPDGLYAIVYPDYSNGYITFDMGEYEEIIDGDGDDFTIYAQGGSYAVSVSMNLTSTFRNIGYISGNQSFDLSSFELDDVRYVRIEYFVGENVEIDAIEAIYHNMRESDTNAPNIQGIDDFWIWENQTSITVTWTASDSTPWTYGILINNSVDVSASWYGLNIEYVFWPESVGTWNVSLLLQDAFGNIAIDSVMIKVKAIPAPTTEPSTEPSTDTTTDTATTDTSATDSPTYVSVIIAGSLCFVVVVAVIYIQRRRP